MAISYTDNFNWPLLDDGSGNSGAVWNGIAEDLDIEVYTAQHPIVNRSGETIISFAQGEVVFKRFSTTGA